METSFTAEQLRDPRIAEANAILRKCVHCGFCTATCPTYVLLGDELDSPRGRIYLIKDMLEAGRPGTEEVARHVDRCLSCLACMTTCPSGVDYMHLVDEARAHIERTYRRPWPDRLMRAALAAILPEPARLSAALALARLGRPFKRLLGAVPGLAPAAAMLDLAPARPAGAQTLGGPGVYPAAGERRARVALLAGCAQPVLAPAINAAAIRLLTRLGVEVVVTAEAGCCGALTHHLGKEADAFARARRNVAAWAALADEPGGLDAVLVTASGCGTTVKDYGHMLRFDEAWRAPAARIAGLARDITEFVAGLGLPQGAGPALRVAYHAACSLQHGQKVTAEPVRLLERAGFTVLPVAEGHLCCGSAGTYNILQPAIARRLGERKAANIEAVRPDVIAAGNLGCMSQIGLYTGVPVVHTVELLDWATGGPAPAGLGGLAEAAA